MSELDTLGYDPAYNANIPDFWWEFDEWRPSKMAYGSGNYGEGGAIDNNWPTYIMANNAYCIMVYLLAQGWQFDAICGMFGNIQGEGNFSPGKWENGHQFETGYGFGFVQWTPATKYQRWAAEQWPLPDRWAPYYYSGWYECYRLAMEGLHNLSTQWLQTPDYPISIQQFATGTLQGTSAADRVRYAASAWLYNYERPSSYGSESQRQARAVAWYDRFQPLFQKESAVLQTALKAEPQKPWPDFTLSDITSGFPKWLYKVMYMASRRGSAYARYSK